MIRMGHEIDHVFGKYEILLLATRQSVRGCSSSSSSSSSAKVHKGLPKPVPRHCKRQMFPSQSCYPSLSPTCRIWVTPWAATAAGSESICAGRAGEHLNSSCRPETHSKSFPYFLTHIWVQHTPCHCFRDSGSVCPWNANRKDTLTRNETDLEVLWTLNSEPEGVDPVISATVSIMVTYHVRTNLTQFSLAKIESMNSGTRKPIRSHAWHHSQPQRKNRPAMGVERRLAKTLQRWGNTNYPRETGANLAALAAQSRHQSASITHSHSSCASNHIKVKIPTLQQLASKKIMHREKLLGVESVVPFVLVLPEMFYLDFM